MNQLTDDEWAYIDGMIVNLCRRYRVTGDTIQETLQEVRLNLLASSYLSKYDPDKGPLKHYLGPRVRGAVKDVIRTNMGRKENINRDRRKMRPHDVVSYNVKSPSEDVNYALAFDERTLDKIIAKDLLNKVLPRLPQRHCAVLKLHYMYGVPMVEIAQQRGVTGSRISQICQVGIARARKECARLDNGGRRTRE